VVAAFLKIDAAGEVSTFLQEQELAGAEIFQCAVAVNAIAADEWALDFKRGVDEPRESVDIRILGNAKRSDDS